MKKRPSPHTPYREKAKGKEILRGCHKQPLRPRARACARYREAGAAARHLIDILHGSEKSDLGIWAMYCYHGDIERIIEKAYEYASLYRQDEIRNPITSFQAWLKRTYGTETWK